MTASTRAPSQKEIDALHSRLFSDPHYGDSHWDDAQSARGIAIVDKAVGESSVYLEARSSREDHDTLLIQATCKRSLLLMRHLLDMGADPDGRNRYYMTPLMAAAIDGFEDGIGLLLARGARIDLRDHTGRGAVLNGTVSRKGSASMYETLINAGANLMEKDFGDFLAFQRQLGQFNPDLASVKVLTQGLPPEVVNARVGEHHGNALYLINGKFEHVLPVFQHLAARGADPSYTTSAGRTALHSAADRQTDIGVIEALVHIGVDVNAQDCAGRTALHIALGSLQDNSYLQALTLIKQGARVDIEDAQGTTPLQMLLKARQPKGFHDVHDNLVALARSSQALSIMDKAANGAAADTVRPL